MLYPQEYGHNLDALIKRFNIEVIGDRHRALPDVIATAEAFIHMTTAANIQSVDELRAKAGGKVVA